MTPSLRSRLALSQIFTILTALVIVTVLAIIEQRRWIVSWHLERLERSARAVEARLADPLQPLPGDAEDRAAALGRLMAVRVTLIDSTGRVVGDSDVPRDRLPLVENHAGRPEVREALAGRIGHATRVSATVSREFVYLAVPARAATGLAVVRLAEPTAEISGIRRSLLGFSLTAALVALFLSMPLTVWVARAQTTRVRELVAVTERIGSGDSNARARELPVDEIGRLGGAINRMAAELRARFDALQRERDERELVLAHMSDGVTLVDREGRVVHANRSAAAVLGAAVAPPSGTPLSSFARSPELDAIVQEARASAQVIERDLRLWAPHQRLVRATATRLPGRDGGGVLLVLHDLTELERLHRVRQDFVANVSHELKTPLTSVRGYAETLLDGGLEDVSRREEFVRVIRDQAKRLQDLVEDLLSLAQLERPDAHLEKTRFDLRQAAEQQVMDLQDRASRAGLSLTLEPGPPTFVQADRGRVDQVLANLLDNALKYTERGSITVSIGVDHGASDEVIAGEPRVWCEVHDTGAGISQEHLGRIFERFYRVDDARSRERGGTGLGLSIVKHIVTLHHGDVSVRSAPGRGSTFRFELPAA